MPRHSPKRRALAGQQVRKWSRLKLRGMVVETCIMRAHIAVGVQDARHVLQLVVGARLVLAPGGQPRTSVVLMCRVGQQWAPISITWCVKRLAVSVAGDSASPGGHDQRCAAHAEEHIGWQVHLLVARVEACRALQRVKGSMHAHARYHIQTSFILCQATVQHTWQTHKGCECS